MVPKRDTIPDPVGLPRDINDVAVKCLLRCWFVVCGVSPHLIDYAAMVNAKGQAGDVEEQESCGTFELFALVARALRALLSLFMRQHGLAVVPVVPKPFPYVGNPYSVLI